MEAVRPFESRHGAIKISPEPCRLRRELCPAGLPALGNELERELLFVGFNATKAVVPCSLASVSASCSGSWSSVGMKQRSVFMLIQRHSHRWSEKMLDLAQSLEAATPHTLRHSLARRPSESASTLRLYSTPSDIVVLLSLASISYQTMMVCVRQ